MDKINTRYVTRDKCFLAGDKNESYVIIWEGEKPVKETNIKTIIFWGGAGREKTYSLKEFKKKYGWTPRKGSCEKVKSVLVRSK